MSRLLRMSQQSRPRSNAAKHESHKSRRQEFMPEKSQRNPSRRAKSRRPGHILRSENGMKNRRARAKCSTCRPHHRRNRSSWSGLLCRQKIRLLALPLDDKKQGKTDRESARQISRESRPTNWSSKRSRSNVSADCATQGNASLRPNIKTSDTVVSSFAWVKWPSTAAISIPRIGFWSAL